MRPMKNKSLDRALFKAGVLDVERAKRNYTTLYRLACEAWCDNNKKRKEVRKSALWITALNFLCALNGAAFLAEALEGTVSGAGAFQGFSALFCAFCACLETVDLRRRWDMLRWCTMDFNSWANTLKRAVESEISEEAEHESF